GFIEHHLTQRQPRESWLLPKKLVEGPQRRDQILHECHIGAYSHSGFCCDIFQFVIDDKKKQIAFVSRIKKQGSESDTGLDRYLARARFIIAVGDKELPGRVRDASLLVLLVELALSGLCRNLSFRHLSQSRPTPPTEGAA